MLHFYATKLQDAGKTIDNLQEKNNHLRMEDQSKENDLKERLTKLRIKNSLLKAKLELLQMKLEMAASNTHHFHSQLAPSNTHHSHSQLAPSNTHHFHSQSAPFGHVNYQGNNTPNLFAHVSGATAGGQPAPAGEQVAFNVLD
jgi:hypothetical protein